MSLGCFTSLDELTMTGPSQEVKPGHIIIRLDQVQAHWKSCYRDQVCPMQEVPTMDETCSFSEGMPEGGQTPVVSSG